jgi:putative N6-adenine-specific DNA methylase
MLDPMCGSGTLLIEAALIAYKRAPGMNRTLAVERWPQLGAQATSDLVELRQRARQAERPPPFPIIGIDKSAAALKTARHNAKAAGVATAIELREGDATAAFSVPPVPLLIVTNPPYGTRLADRGQKMMKSFYYRLGERFAQLTGARIVVLSGNPAFESAFHMRPIRRRRLYNGPIACELLTYRVA